MSAASGFIASSLTFQMAPRQAGFPSPIRNWPNTKLRQHRNPCARSKCIVEIDSAIVLFSRTA